MQGAELVRAAGGAIGIVALVATFSAAPSSIAAADEPTLVLPGTTHSAITVDLDGDGARELVRIASEFGLPHGWVEAWEHDPGGWSSRASAPMQRQSSTGDGLVPLQVDRDAAALLPWRVEGRDGVLALTAGWAPGSATCCLSIAEVRLADVGLTLHPVAVLESAGTIFEAADVDGDGTDELLLVEYSQTSAQGPQRLQLLRWNGSEFEIAFEREDSGEFLGVWTGESDGIPGDEVLLGPTVSGRLERIAWVDGEPRTETAILEPGRGFDGWAVGAAGGVAVLALSDGVHVLSWPRGGDAIGARHETSAEFPNVFLAGTGPDALIVLFDGQARGASELPVATVYDLGLRPLAEIRPAAAAEEAWTVAQRQLSQGFGMDPLLFPYAGPIPNGWSDERPAVIANGMLMLPDGSGGLEQHSFSTLAGTMPIGLAGPGAEWVAICDGFFFGPQQVYLSAGPGGVPPLGEVTIAPLDMLLGPDDEVAVGSLTLRDAVETGEPIDGVQTLLSDGAGFEVVVEAEPGSQVFLLDSWRSREHDVGNSPLVVEVRAPRTSRTAENQRLDVTLVVVTPEGRVSAARWEGAFVRELPTLTVGASTETLALRARLEGQASPGATVTVDDHQIGADTDGHFAVDIDAPIWPSSVIVTARDPLGNETTNLVEVVGVYDYRGLPWPAFVVVATIVAGAALFLRVPKARPEAVALGLSGDPRLEEIELDAADADAPGRVQ